MGRNFDMRTARKQLLVEGFCIVDGELPDGKLEELQAWSDEWPATTRHPARWKYQGSDIHISGVRNVSKRHPDLPRDDVVDFLIEHPKEIMAALGLDDFRSGGTFQIISKPAGAPALYWHQDWARWDDPISKSPWPQQVFLNWYLTDTEVANGCLRVIPGSHRRRVDLHEHLTPPHESGGYEVEETNEWMFYNHPDAVDVPISVGQLLIADARLLHGTHPNASTERRTVLLGWFYRRSNEVPRGWEGDVPSEILERTSDLPFRWNRVPGVYLT
ncbi:MAG: phytanoyl-CoA dioxygenase family protein [Gammaproteobacteria bacterium]|nr:phytanoyl-CoA dioxygenase family protein [Gammaproteobacteria bacterium]